MRLKQHPNLTPEKWRAYPFSRRILMVANELHRAGHWLGRGDREEVKECYERALELLDLTISLATRTSLLRELLRFRELLAAEFIAENPGLETNRSLYRVLLAFDSNSYAVLADDPAEAA